MSETQLRPPLRTAVGLAAVIVQRRYLARPGYLWLRRMTLTVSTMHTARMDDSRAPEPWIGGPADSEGCRLRWHIDGPACGAPVTLHVVCESAMYGVTYLPTCERHAPVAREAGIYLREHSPSFPGCDCRQITKPQPLAEGVEIRSLPFRPEERITLAVRRPRHLERPPYDPDLERRMRASGDTYWSADGITHYLNGDNRALCGAGKYLAASDQHKIVCSFNWRIVSCPTCRATETP